MTLAQQVLSLTEEKWSGEVKTRFHPKPGLFASGSAQEIADYLHKRCHSFQQCMSRVTFYLNRAGDNLSPERKRTLERVKDLLEKKRQELEK
jgi:hypothetical protein